MYEIEYLPMALKDLNKITNYIAAILCNRKAALEFIDTLDNSIRRLQLFPYSCKLYKSHASIDSEYRLLPVKNYLVFYVVLENKVEIRRVIYNRVDLDVELSR